MYFNKGVEGELCMTDRVVPRLEHKDILWS